MPGIVKGPDKPPQDGDEGHQRHHGPENAEREAEGARNEQAQVLGDALIGVVRLGGLELHAIVGLVGQPRPEIPVGEPAPPADLQHLVQVELYTASTM